MFCVACSNQLQKPQKLYCSKVCEYRTHDIRRGRYKGAVERTCRNCASIFESSGHRVFCSVICRRDWWADKGKKHTTKLCTNCTKSFDGPPRNKYCSSKCRTTYWSAREIKDRAKVNAYIRQKRQTDPLFKLRTQLSDRIRKKMRAHDTVKDRTLADVLGCSIPELRLHLQKQFDDTMTWDNYGVSGWHIDHIIPLATATTKEGIYELWHFTNLQPLWAKDNLAKGAKVIGRKPSKPLGHPSQDM